MNDKTQKCNGTCEVCDCQNTASKPKLKKRKATNPHCEPSAQYNFK